LPAKVYIENSSVPSDIFSIRRYITVRFVVLKGSNSNYRHHSNSLIMRILIVSRYFPENLETDVHGVFKRFNIFLTAIKDIAEIDLLYYVPEKICVSKSEVLRLEKQFSDHFNATITLYLCKYFKEKNPESRLKRTTKSIFSLHNLPFYQSNSGIEQVAAFEECLKKHPDAVFVHRLVSMCPLLKTKKKKLPPIFFDLDDIEHVALLRGLRHFGGFLSKLHNLLLVPAICIGEYRAINKAHRTFVCSEEDRRYLQTIWKHRGVVSIPNAVEIPPAQKITSNPILLFLGTYKHRPNVQSAEFLIQKIWPIIRRALPSAKLIIAGSSPERISMFKKHIPGVEFVGFVENLPRLYEHTRVVCVPVISGSGTRIKILEAASYGKPIVSTEIGAEGIDLKDNKQILIRNNAESFAAACIELLTEKCRCEEIGKSARCLISRKYDRDSVITKIKVLITDELLNAKS